jgi:hypothetical protein
MSALALAVLLGASTAVRAEDKSAEKKQPVLVVSLSGYDQIRSDLEWLGKLGNNSELAAQAEAGLKGILGVENLDGLDKTRPWGLVIETANDEFTGYGFLPVTDLKKLLKTFEERVGEPKEADKGVQEIDVEGRTMFVKGVNGWAFISTSPDALANVPKDPVKLLDGLNTTYDVGVRVIVKNIPQMTRQTLLLPIQMGVQMGMERQPGETDEQFALRNKMAQDAMEQLSAMINDLDTLVVGLALDPKGAVGRFEYSVTAVPGTKTAEQFAQAKAQKTQFAGFQQAEAALSVVAASQLGDRDVAQTKLAIETRKTQAVAELEKQGLGDEEMKLAKRLINDLADVVQKTIEGKQWDGGAVVFLDADRLTVVAGSVVADTAKVEQLIKDLATQAAKDQPELAAAIKMNAEQHQGYRFTRIAVPTSQLGQAADLSKFVGDTLEVIIALGEKNVYVSAGRDAAKTLKQVIDKSRAEAGKTIPPMVMVVAGKPIARFAQAAAEADKDKAQAKKILDLLQKSEAKDQVSVTSSPMPNGVQVRVEAQEGILRILGALPTLTK